MLDQVPYGYCARETTSQPDSGLRCIGRFTRRPGTAEAVRRLFEELGTECEVVDGSNPGYESQHGFHKITGAQR